MGACNIKTLGTCWYTYDKVNRLVSATLYDSPTGGGTQKQQSYTFDAFGNLTNIAGTVGRATPTSAQTNRLNGAGTVYDAAGNLTNWNGASYQYDAFNQMIHMNSGQEDAVYLYTADDERLWSYDLFRDISRWALRDLGGKVLREYQNNSGRWSAGTDYIYRDGLLLAAETPAGRRHFHLDHLGTPRLITRASGYSAGYHVYYPFGEEATAFNQDTERLKFTGHERDLASPAGAGDDLDYMHARHESPLTGRFMSVDPVGKSFDLKSPQSWNRYAYVQNSPMNAIDPSGEVLVFTGSTEQFRQIESIANQGLHGARLVIDNSGTARLVPTNESGPPTPEQAALAGVLGRAINDRQTISLGLVTGDSGVMVGSFNTGQVDVQDLAAAGRGPVVSGFSMLAHEVSEQTDKQTLGLVNINVDGGQQFEVAHGMANIAQSAVSGFQRGESRRNLANGTGTTVTSHARGAQTVTVTIIWNNGNIVRVLRQ